MLVTDLTRADFEVLDNGERRPITDFRAERSAVSVALLFDGSGSMQLAEKAESARRAARQILAWLQAGRDELAIYAFDTALHQLEPFALYREDATLERSLFGRTPFGMTSLNDAIAATAKDLATRPNSHRAVIVLTDGRDNHSRLSPADASVIANSIDVPVYIMAVVSPLDHAGATTAVNTETPVPVGDLADLARRTGGEFFVTSAAGQDRPGRPTDCRRTPPSVPHRVRTGPSARVAPARGARQGPPARGQGARRLRGGAARNRPFRISHST